MLKSAKNGLLYASAALLSLCSCKSKPAAPTVQKSQATVVDVMVATTQPVSSNVEVNGTVVANESTELHPEVNGRLTFLNIPEGQFVSQGTVLARVNSADLQAQLNKSKVQLALAEQTEQRFKKLLDINGVNQADYDVALNQVNSLKADIEYTQAQIDKTVVRAPFSGTIGLRQVSPGAYVTTATVLATIQATNNLKIDFTIPESYSGYIQKGSDVDVLIDEANNKTAKAKIIATEPQVVETTRNLKVRAILQNATANPGAFVKVYLTTGRDKSSVLVPTNAIIPDASGTKIVEVKNGKAAFTSVETGERNAGAIEVTKGLEAGDTIVISGVLFARPNAPLQIRSVKKLSDLTQ